MNSHSHKAVYGSFVHTEVYCYVQGIIRLKLGKGLVKLYNVEKKRFSADQPMQFNSNHKLQLYPEIYLPI